MKVLRGCRAMWLTFDKDASKDFTCLGKDSDDLSIDNNPSIEQKQNVQGETSTDHNGYTPSMSNEYIARTEDSIYKHIQYISDNLATDDEHIRATMIVATLDIEVKDATGEKTAKGNGYKVPVKVVVDNDGGGTAGYSMPFTIYEDGARVQGSVVVTDKQPKFTAGTSVDTLSTKSSTQVRSSSRDTTEQSAQ